MKKTNKRRIRGAGNIRSPRSSIPFLLLELCLQARCLGKKSSQKDCWERYQEFFFPSHIKKKHVSATCDKKNQCLKQWLLKP